MKCSSALARGIRNRSIGTIALIQRSGTGKSGSGNVGLMQAVERFEPDGSRCFE
jgi:DNA-directed RNA polymerase sigma subunit (sigma70/sigma32)